jgi:putative SOS response-associated peptidase YedK
MCVRMYFMETKEFEKAFDLYKIDDLVRFRLDHAKELSNNLSPSQVQIIVRKTDYGVVTELATWGLIPNFTKDLNSKYNMSNTRIESIIEKPYFKGRLHHHRCIIPVNGYYEWHGETGKKQPYAFSDPKMKTFYLGGLWDIWTDDTGEEVLSFSIITKPADNQYSEIHPRMPLVMNLENAHKWIEDNDSKDLDKMIVEFAELTNYASKYNGITLDPVMVDKAMNNPDNLTFDISSYITKSE